jgi:putative colanic acid biosynthesis UDP-glucose lipid carrier transferase
MFSTTDAQNYQDNPPRLRAFENFIRRNETLLAFLYRLADALIIALSFELVLWFSQLAFDKHTPAESYRLLAGLAMLAFWLFAEYRHLYRSWRGISLSRQIGLLWSIWLGVGGLLLLFLFASKSGSLYSRQAVMTWLLLAPALLSVLRFFLTLAAHVLRVQGRNTRRVAIIGAGGMGAKLAQTIQAAPWMGLELQGIYDHRSSVPQTDNFRGNTRLLLQQAFHGNIDRIYIALPMHEEDAIRDLLKDLANTTAAVYLVPDLSLFDPLHMRWDAVGEIPSVSIFENPFHGFNGILKRIEDIVLGFLILLLITVPMSLIALGIKLSSPGPVLFKQRRYGLDGKEIWVWKFRTMTVCEDGTNFTQACKNDARVTRFGAFLRRTSLDELPQFINVLQGRMSIVGPRPHAVAMNEEYRYKINGYMLRHKVKPGITGLAQVNGWRGETDTEDKMLKRVEHDLLYIRNWSLWLDLKIIFLTVVHGFVHKNAY